MTSPADLARELTGLDIDARQHLERLMASWGLLADLSFSDLLLYVPLDEYSLAVSESVTSGRGTGELSGLHFVVLGQMRPTTNQTQFELDLVGQVLEASELPVITEAWRSGSITRESPIPGSDPSALSYECIPVRRRDIVVAVLVRAWSPSVGRRSGGLERVYVRIFERLAAMVSSGLYPFLADEAAIEEEAPRVGDGVIVLDASQRITFASPNAVNALHRMGIVSSIVGSSLGELGIETEAVRSAYLRRLPVTEEIERRPDVIVLLRCIPLIEGDEVIEAAILLRDVTDLRRRDRLLLSKDAAIREVHHRVKNNLQTISSLLRLQARRVEVRSARVALLEAERRIRAIALVHEILARDPGEQIPFGEIVPALVRMARDANVSNRNVDVRVHGDAGAVVADVATPLAVVIAELLLNAVEHAFGAGDGSQTVDLSFENDGTELVVEVRDNGAGFPAGFNLDNTPSLGLAIVRDLVRSQLAGSITMANDAGAVVRIVVPLVADGRV